MSNNTIYAGIDIGKSGAVAVLYPDNTVVLRDIPVVKLRNKTSSALKSGKNKGERKARTTTKIQYDLPGILEMFRELAEPDPEQFQPIRICLEAVHARPGNGIKQAFEYGRGLALIEMALVAAGLDWEPVTPGQWRVAMVGRGTDKQAAVIRARRMFPKAGLKQARKSEGPAEALLMAAYLRIRDAGGNFSRKVGKPSSVRATGLVSSPEAPVASRKRPAAKKAPKTAPGKQRARPDQQDLQEAFDEMQANPAPILIPGDHPKIKSFAERRAAWKARKGAT